MSLVQFTDTHIVREGSSYFGVDTAEYLRDAVAAVNALDPAPEYAVVTGDIANWGAVDEYARFRDIMSELHIPYVAIPGNHDDRDRMREVLPPETFRAADGPTVRFAVDDFTIRLACIEANRPRPWPGACADPADIEWLDQTLAARADVPTIVAVHQPPFRTGLHYLDMLGFVGGRRLHQVIDSHPQVGRVISGHIHCVRSAQWKRALAISAPSTARQIIPLLFMDGHILGIRHEAPGFAVHALDENNALHTTIYRRDEAGHYGTM